jgi:hypothetical protein
VDQDKHLWHVGGVVKQESMRGFSDHIENEKELSQRKVHYQHPKNYCSNPRAQHPNPDYSPVAAVPEL